MAVYRWRGADRFKHFSSAIPSRVWLKRAKELVDAEVGCID
jgi:hypothetical protein